MRRIVFGVAALVAASLAGCSDSPSETPRVDTAVLAVGQTAVIGGVEVTLVSVDDDSRCPPEVDCFWSGDATVALDARIGSTRHSLRLHTDVEPREDRIADRSVRLVELAPSTRADQPLPQSAYRATIRVAPAG